MAIVNHRDIATNGLDEEALTTSTAGEQVINSGALATSGDLAEAFMGQTGCRRHEPKDFQFWGNRWVVPLRKSLIAAILTFLATFNGPTVPAFAHQVPVRVMTQNMYLGADFRPLLAATTPAEFVAALTQIYQSILATKTAERAAAVAREIVRERADVVALQEVWILRTGSAPATDVKSDQLEALLGELRRLGQPYEAVAILPNTGLPSSDFARLRRPAHGPDGDHCAGGCFWTTP